MPKMHDHPSPSGERSESETVPKTSVKNGTTPLPAPRTVCPCNKSGRNLVVCIDGTANQFGLKVCVILYLSVQSLLRSPQNTNVVELYKRLQKDDDQLTYYDSGIGTYVKEGSFNFRAVRQWLDFTIDMAIAW